MIQQIRSGQQSTERQKQGGLLPIKMVGHERPGNKRSSSLVLPNNTLHLEARIRKICLYVALILFFCLHYQIRVSRVLAQHASADFEQATVTAIESEIIAHIFLPFVSYDAAEMPQGAAPTPTLIAGEQPTATASVIVSEEATAMASDTPLATLPVVAGEQTPFATPSLVLTEANTPIAHGELTATTTETSISSPAETEETVSTPTATPTPTATSMALATYTATPTATSTPIPLPTATPGLKPTGPTVIYLSATTAGVVNNIAFGREDILAFNTATHTWSLFFDGSDVGVTANLDAFNLEADGTILISLDSSILLPGIVAPVDPTDIVRFAPTSLGENSTGQFVMFFDGQSVGLERTSENIDAIARTGDGRLLLSTSGAFSVPGLEGGPEDLARFTAASLGETTSGTWDLYFDGEDVGIGATPEGLEGIWIDPFSGALYLTMRRDYAIYGGLSGDTDDIIVCTPVRLGEITDCYFSRFWDGDAYGFGTQRIDGVDFTGEMPPAPSIAPTPAPAPLSPANDTLFFSFGVAGVVNGIAYTPQDIVSYNRTTNGWSLLFDGSDLRIASEIDAFHFDKDGSILLSFASETLLPGLAEIVDEADIVQFIPTALGQNTAGNFALVLDGSDVELGNSGEDIDAIGCSPDGRLVISVNGSFAVSGYSGDDEDLLVFNAASLGENTSGAWEKYFDGADVGLDLNASEDVEGLWIDPETGALYLGVRSSFTLYGGLSGDVDDIFLCTPIMLGETTICGFSIFWDGDAHGAGDRPITGFGIGVARDR